MVEVGLSEVERLACSQPARHRITISARSRRHLLVRRAARMTATRQTVGRSTASSDAWEASAADGVFRLAFSTPSAGGGCRPSAAAGIGAQ
jgi:hypothetical protein